MSRAQEAERTEERRMDSGNDDKGMKGITPAVAQAGARDNAVIASVRRALLPGTRLSGASCS